MDRRPSYLWGSAILANIGALALLIKEAFSQDIKFGSFAAGAAFFLSIMVPVTIVPIKLSQSKNESAKRFVHIALILLFIGSLLFTWYAITCTGFLCDLAGSMFAAYGFGITLVFWLFYAIAKNALKRDEKFIRSVIWIECLVFAIALLGMS